VFVDEAMLLRILFKSFPRGSKFYLMVDFAFLLLFFEVVFFKKSVFKDVSKFVVCSLHQQWSSVNYYPLLLYPKILSICFPRFFYLFYLDVYSSLTTQEIRLTQYSCKISYEIKMASKRMSWQTCNKREKSLEISGESAKKKKFSVTSSLFFSIHLWFSKCLSFYSAT